MIAGWSITPGMISSSAGNVQIDASNSRFLISDDSNRQRVRMGKLNDSGQYGISGSDENGKLLFKLGEAGNEIAGWRITEGVLDFDSSGGSIALDATNKRIAIYTGSINTAKPKVVMGNLPTTGAGRYGFAVFSGSANADINNDDTYSVLITKDKARLAGWDLVPGRLKSGTVADINGNKASIALGGGSGGTNALNAGSTPTQNLFFVSASSNPIFYVGENFSYVDDVLTAAGWTIGKGQISSSNGKAILSGSGVLSLGTGTHNFAQSNRTYIDGPGNRMSIGQYFQFTSNVLTVADWQIGDKKIIYNDSGTERLRLDANTGDLQVDGDDAIGIVLGNVGGGVDLTSNTALPLFFGTKEDGSRSVFRVGSASAFLKFDTGTGLEVSSSNFHIQTNGNVKMTGTVTATAGAIGGFTISNNDITGSGGTFVTSNRRFSGFGSAEDTSRVELSKHNLRIVTAAGDPYSTTGYLPSHIVFDAIVTSSFSYFQGESVTTKFRNRFRTENIELGMYDANASWTSGNLYIGKGGKTNASIRTALGDSDPSSIITPDTSNNGWVIGDNLEVKAVGTGNSVTRTNTSYRFSVVGTSYFSSTMTVAGGLVANGNVDLGDATSDTITFTGRVDSHVLPASSATYDLGGSSNRWNNIYTTDLQLSNMDKDKGNDVDGTRGDWTLQEGDENLYVINNISGKKYKIALIPMDDKDE